jgi:hypothetical protein
MAAEPLRFDYDFTHGYETRSWADIASENASWTAVAETYESWQDLLYSWIDPIGDATLPAAADGLIYQMQLRVRGGVPPYIYELAEGELPGPEGDLELDRETGVIGGLPTEVAESVAFVVRVFDSEETEALARFHLEILTGPPPAPAVPAPPPPRPPLSIELDNGPVMSLGDDGMLHITEVDYGYPEVREVSDDRTQADGAIDQTEFFGSRVVTLTGKIAIDWQSHGRRQVVMDRLAPFLVPGARPWLYSRFDDGQVRRIMLRPDQFSRPQIANVQDISLSFKSPTGVHESEDARRVRLIPEVAVQGRTYDLIHPRVYPLGSGAIWLIRNAGNTWANWIARIFGPCEAPAVENVSTGEMVDLASLTLGGDEFVDVDSREHTVLADGLRDSSRWHTVDYANSTWWRLPPESTTMLRFHCHWWEKPAQMLFYWRDTSLL